MREFLSSFAKIEFDKVKQRIKRHLLTPVGIEHLNAMVPGVDPRRIEEELHITSEMKRLTEEGSPLPISEFPDLRVTLQRASIIEYVLTTPELLAISRLAKNVREIKSFFYRKSAEYPLLSGLISLLKVDKILEYNISQAIDDEGKIVDGASIGLLRIRRDLRRSGETLRLKMEAILLSLQKKGFTQEDLITARDGRLVIPVRSEFKTQVPGFIHSISASGATAFIEPTQTLELNNEIRSFESQESLEIQKILAGLTDQVRACIPDLLANIGILGRLDFLNAKAKFSIESIGAEPKIADHRLLRLKNAYHPILLATHRRDEVTPLTLDAGGEFNTLIISGPNAGGKSVAMKTVGLLTVLTQSGCHIPASPDSEIPVFAELFVEMGDEQSIENDLSTFSSHLNNLKIILEHSTEQSLVLIDEIGTGTDPVLGSALGIAVLESLSDRNALTVVTSHHGAFKTCGFDHNDMENGGMGFDTKTLTPNYKLSIGVPGNSYALEIAKNLKFPETVLQRSFDLTGEESVRLTEYLTRLESRTNELENLLESTHTERKKLKEMVDLYQTRLNSVNEEVKSIRSEAKQEAEEIVLNLKSRIETLVKEIRESSASSVSIRHAREEIQKIRKTITAEEKTEGKQLDFKVSVGQSVKIVGTETVGEVVGTLPGGRVKILAGGKAITLKKYQIEPAETELAKILIRNNLVGITDVKNEIDIRGQYGEEAIQTLDGYIDRAVLAGLTHIRIIHGKGTGALRKRVGEYLKMNTRVISFNLGEWNEGGTGVTVAELRV